MFDSINRMEGPTIDWSQMSRIKKQTSGEDNLALSSSSTYVNQNNVNTSLKEGKDQLVKELEKANSQFQALSHSLRMKFNEDAEQFYVEVVDIRTREVLDSIPAEHVLELAAKIKDMVGFFIDEKR